MFILIFFSVFLIIFSGYLSASETAFFSLSSFTLRSYKRSPDKRKQQIAALLDHPRDLLVSILILMICSNILVQNTIASIFDHYSSWALNVGLPLFLTLFFGDIIPKSLALPNNKAFSAFTVPFLNVIFVLLRPIRSFLTITTEYVSKCLFFYLKKEDPLSYDELKLMLQTSKDKGVIHSHERELITGYLELCQSLIKEKMRPKEEIFFYDLNSPLSVLVETFSNCDCSYVPVCKGGLDQIIGLISIKEFFLHYRKNLDMNGMRKYLLKPFYVPENINSWSCFHQMRTRQCEIALVVDEYGTVTGLVAQEDLFEEVVGEIEDEREKKEKYTQSGKDVIIAAGTMELEDFEELFSVTLPSEGHPVTLGGWLMEQMETVPQPGRTFETPDFFFYVLSADPNRIRRIYVRFRKKTLNRE